jgi:hypothetical protein
MYHRALTAPSTHRNCATLKYAGGTSANRGHVYLGSTRISGEALLSEACFKGLLASGEDLLRSAYEGGCQPISMSGADHREFQVRYCNSMLIMVSATSGGCTTLTAEEYLGLLQARGTVLAEAKDRAGREVIVPGMGHETMSKFGRQLLRDRESVWLPSGGTCYNSALL